MVDVHSIANDQVRSAFKRWQNLEEEKARVADDLKELFAEQKALGHDTKAMRAAFRLKVKLDEADPAEAEHEALVDTYLAALDAPRASRAYAREKIEHFDANPRLIKQVVDGMQTEAGRAALLTAVDIMIARDEAEENSPETATEREAVAAICEATVSTQPKDVSLPADGESSEGASAGGIDVDRSGSPATHLVTGEGTALSALPDNSGVTLEYVPSSGVKRLPFASCFPELSKSDYERLEKDIAANRVQTPIIRQGDVIVDGWNRYTIARKYGFAYPVEELHPGRDVLLLVIELQRASRNFTTAQSAKIAADLAKEFPHRADEIMTAFGLVEAMEAAE